MSPPDQIAAHRDRTLSELDAGEQYLTDTRRVWRLTQQLAEAGRRAGVETVAGESVADLTALADNAQRYVTGALVESVFQQTLAAFEAFVADLLTTWLTAYPGSLRKKQFEFGLALDAVDRNGVIAGVIAAEVGGLLYEPLAKQFAYLASRIGIDPPAADRTSQLAEARATRNVLVHNRGVVNAAYRTLAGANARYQIGQRVEVSEPYRREVWELVRQMVADLADAALAKLAPAAPDLPPPADPG